MTTGKPKEVTRTVAEVLLQKRITFEFEQEVRLLWLDQGPRRPCALLNINPRALIDQIRLSPYATDAQARAIKAEVEGYGIRFKRSGLIQVRLSAPNGAMGQDVRAV